MMDEYSARSIAQSLGDISDTMIQNRSSISIKGDLSDAEACRGIRLIVDAQNAKIALESILGVLRGACKHDTVPYFVQDEERQAFIDAADDFRRLIWEEFERYEAEAFLRD